MGTGAALLTALVWELCGGDGVVSTGTGLLSAGVGDRLGEASSPTITVGVQPARVWVRRGSTVTLGTGAALLTSLVWEL